MEREIVDILAELGRRLTAFGGGDADARRAAQAVACNMLSREVLGEWLARYPALPVVVPKDVLIIMAGNIPFVGMHDLVCVLASGHRAIVKPSSKDGDMMAWVVAQLLEIAPDLPVLLTADASCVRPDAVVAMGGDDTVEALARRYAGVPMLLRGHRSSLAVLDGDETGVELAALADDILCYSGLGCRNVSLVLVPCGYDFCGLQSALIQDETMYDMKHRGNYVQARAVMGMTAVPYMDCGSCLLVEKDEFPIDVSVINYAFYDTSLEVMNWIAGHDGEIQCIAASARLGLSHPRAVALGRTQRPGLSDYPDGRDTMQFLAKI